VKNGEWKLVHLYPPLIVLLQLAKLVEAELSVADTGVLPRDRNR